MKNYIIYSPTIAINFKSFDTKEDAEGEAKRLTAKHNGTFGIYTLTSKTVNPVPDIQIVEVKV